MAEGRWYLMCKFEFDTLSFAACVNVSLPNFTVQRGYATLRNATVAPPGDRRASPSVPIGSLGGRPASGAVWWTWLLSWPIGMRSKPTRQLAEHRLFLQVRPDRSPGIQDRLVRRSLRSNRSQALGPKPTKLGQNVQRARANRGRPAAACCRRQVALRWR